MTVADSEFEKWKDTTDYLSMESAYAAGFNRALELLTVRFMNRKSNYGNQIETNREEQHVQIYGGEQRPICVEAVRMDTPD
jgi:hypothetical protein